MKKFFSLVLALAATTSMALAAVQQAQETVNCGTQKTIRATPKTGYHFVRWNDDNEGYLDNPRTVTVNSDITYTATFEINSYTIRFMNGSVELQSSSVNYGILPEYTGETPVKASTAQYEYAFSGWSPLLVVATEDVDYVAQFSETVRKYTIVFLNWDGTELQSSQVEYGTVPSYSGTPSRTGEGKTYTFKGWDVTPVAVTGEATYTAQFDEAVNTYEITYAKGSPAEEISGSVDATVKTHGVDATLPSVGFTRTGYTQDGWATSDGGEKVYDMGDSYTTNAAATLYPHWVVNSYTISVNASEGGSVSGNGVYNHGQEVTITATPDGCYHFEKWSDDDTNATRTFPASENVSLTATFEIDTHTLTVQSADDSMGTVSIDGE